MTYEAFRQSAYIRSSEGVGPIDAYRYCGNGRFADEWKSGSENLPFLNDQHWVASSEISAITGGSCYGGQNYQESRKDETNGTIPSLVEYLLSLNGLSYRDAYDLLGKIKTIEWEEKGYYGNSRTYVVRYISYKEVYDRLKGLNLI